MGDELGVPLKSKDKKLKGVLIIEYQAESIEQLDDFEEDLRGVLQYSSIINNIKRV